MPAGFSTARTYVDAALHRRWDLHPTAALLLCNMCLCILMYFVKVGVPTGDTLGLSSIILFCNIMYWELG